MSKGARETRPAPRSDGGDARLTGGHIYRDIDVPGHGRVRFFNDRAIDEALTRAGEKVLEILKRKSA